MRPRRAYRCSTPSGVLGGKNSKLMNGSACEAAPRGTQAPVGDWRRAFQTAKRGRSYRRDFSFHSIDDLAAGCGRGGVHLGPRGTLNPLAAIARRKILQAGRAAEEGEQLEERNAGRERCCATAAAQRRDFVDWLLLTSLPLSHLTAPRVRAFRHGSAIGQRELIFLPRR